MGAPECSGEVTPRPQNRQRRHARARPPVYAALARTRAAPEYCPPAGTVVAALTPALRCHNGRTRSRPSLACHAATRGSRDGEDTSHMPLLLHLADVHLGRAPRGHGRRRSQAARAPAGGLRARHRRGPQGRAWMSALICGDLFDSNAQPRRSVERAVSELKRLTDAGIRVVIIPGTHDVYDSRSIYRAFDLARMAGLPPRQRPAHGAHARAPELLLQRPRPHRLRPRVFATKRAPRSPLEGFSRPSRRPCQLEGGHDPRLAPASPARSTVTTSSSAMPRSPPAASTTSPWATGTRSPRGRAGEHHLGLCRGARAGGRGPGRCRQRLPGAARGRHRRDQQRAGRAGPRGPHGLPGRVASTPLR